MREDDHDEWENLAAELRALNPRMYSRVLTALRDIVLGLRVRQSAAVRFLALRTPTREKHSRRA